MPDSVLLIMAEQNGEWVAGAMYLWDRRRLYGRYWGAEVDVPGLHFEACYYQGIEFCIEQGLECFDAGAQGEHKLIRGFEPVQTDSLHWIEEERFRDAIRQFCEEEARHVEAYMKAAHDALPYRVTDGQVR
jgi:predicted N-acyltransferase